MIIGISGKIGCGKDTVKDILTEEFEINGSTVEHRSFAKRLKEVVATLTGSTYEEQCTHEGKNKINPLLGVTNGQLQQYLGQTLRNVNKNIWVNLALDSPVTTDYIIFSDVRYPNECQRILEDGGVLLRLEGDPKGEREKTTRNINHPSETILDNYPFTYVIRNDSTLDELKRKVLSWVDDVIHQC